jgi:hypothetical protein
MSLYSRLGASQLGSSAMFGGAFFLATLASDGLHEAMTAGALAAASWFASQPLLKRLIGAASGA